MLFKQRKERRGLIDILLKIILYISSYKKEVYKTVNFRGDIYIVKIEEYIPTEEEMQKWKSALDNSKARKD